MSELAQQSQLAVPFGYTSEFVLACPRNVFNFYPSIENAAADADRANGKKCGCGHVFTDADEIRTGESWRAIVCSACGKLSHQDGQTYAPMMWDDFVKAQRDFYLDGEPTQITEEKWNYAFEVLPPEQFEHVGNLVSFLMMEHWSGPYTHQYVARGIGATTTYWTKMVHSLDRSTWMTNESLGRLAGRVTQEVTA